MVGPRSSIECVLPIPYVESTLAGTVKMTDIEDLDPIFLELET